LRSTDASSTISTTALSIGRVFRLGDRSANIGVAVPYVIGNVEGQVLGIPDSVQRSGLADLRVRAAMNLYGAPAMTAREFAAYRQSTIVGVSLHVVVPVGQYASRKLINIGTNRWAFKPEVGLSRARGRWTIETYGGVWLFTTNDEFFGDHVREQRPIALLQFHVEYTIRRGMWIAGNANFYAGGRTVIDGRASADLQRNSRVGVTWLFPAGRGRAVRLAVSRGAYTTVGADFTSLSAVYQYAWMGKK
jgi:Putative MetA-pathway of phenol degradation